MISQHTLAYSPFEEIMHYAINEFREVGIHSSCTEIYGLTTV